jgi:hypothetical protein
MIALISEEGQVAPHGYWVDGFLGDGGEVGPKTPLPGCRCTKNVGRGDSAAPPFVVA